MIDTQLLQSPDASVVEPITSDASWQAVVVAFRLLFSPVRWGRGMVAKFTDDEAPDLELVVRLRHAAISGMVVVGGAPRSKDGGGTLGEVWPLSRRRARDRCRPIS
jgi:hypothetical protein